MAVKIVGDCGKPNCIATEFVQRGSVVKRDYCVNCVGFVDDYLAARDELHTALAARWAEGLAALKAGMPEGLALPDEPDR